MEPEKVVDYRGYKIKVHQDEDPESPREWDNVGTMVCWHNRYKLGDEQPKEDYREWLEGLAFGFDETLEARLEELYEKMCPSIGDTTTPYYKKEREEINKAIDENCTMLPLYLYDHGGITMRTGPFGCPWDSGQVGVIYVTNERAKAEYGDYSQEAVIKHLEGEVKVYDDYLTGQVYGYVIKDANDEEVESCWGYYGYADGFSDDGYMLGECRSIVDSCILHLEGEAWEENKLRAPILHVMYLGGE